MGGRVLHLLALGQRPVNPLPTLTSRLENPLVRADTLTRRRLNSWLDRAARNRLVLVVGDAGFGKTTLLADWASLSARRTAWYGLEPDDRDWLTFIRHLIASVRVVDPGFGPETYRMLCALGPGGPSQDELVATLAREMAAFGAAEEHGFSLVLDDYQAIESAEDTDPVMAALLEATGPGYSLVIAARKSPKLPARVRGRGAVHRLETDLLRFDEAETEALFRDTYSIELEPDVARDLVARTEGWAALLSLVRTRLEEHAAPDPRALVAQLSAAQGDLYDFLAEEVVGDLPPELADFLMHASILSEVSPATARLVDARDPAEVEASIAQAIGLGLLPLPGRNGAHRFHPLVRDFLEAKLEATIGTARFRQQHRSIAETLEPTDWRESALHYRAAGDPGAAARVVDEAIPAIIGSGSLEAALPLIDGTAGPSDRPGALILRSRIEYARGNLERAINLGERAADIAGDTLSGIAMLNLSALEGVAGYSDQAVEKAEIALQRELTTADRKVAEASRRMREAREAGDLNEIADRLRFLAHEQERAGLKRYAAVSSLNLATVLTWLGRPSDALGAAMHALALNDAHDGLEWISAMAARALALLQLRKDAEAAMVLRRILDTTSPVGRVEAAIEVSFCESTYGSAARAREALQQLHPSAIPRAYKGAWHLAEGLAALRSGDADEALRHGYALSESGLNDPAGRFRTELLVARARLLAGDPDARSCIPALADRAASQRSSLCAAIARLLDATVSSSKPGTEITSLGINERHVLSILADEVCLRLDDLTPGAATVVAEEAHARPERWRTALRQAIERSGRSSVSAARLLAEIGVEEDRRYLRALAVNSKAMREPAASIASRLAHKPVIHDLGVVRLEIGGQIAERTSRRKAMALLCFLASRPRQAATRDEALDALWQDVDPEMGVNSLHQTIFYVRRLLDPDYREGISPGYLTFDGEIVTLEPSLVDTDSARCWRLLRTTIPRDLSGTERILSIYQGRFALDFMYEEWATDYRETLHAAVLGRVEASMAACLETGDLELAIQFGTAILAVDPGADSIELALLRAYKAAGRHAAAGEQYAHYASTLRDELGVEPPPFDSL